MSFPFFITYKPISDLKCIFTALLMSSILSGGCKSANSSQPDENTSEAQTWEWENISVPAEAGAKKEWKLLEKVSDDFNYPDKEGFHQKWYDNHIRGWKGPGATYFNSEHSFIADSNLILTASRVPEDKQGPIRDYDGFKTRKTIYTGFVTAKKTITYPVFVEAKIKVSGLELASAFWSLSDDDRYEIDILETWPADPWFGKRMSTNYHIFKRDEQTNEILAHYGDEQRFYLAEGEPYLKEDYHRYGMYWKSPTWIEFYLDGRLVRVLNKDNDLRDPMGNFYESPQRLIMDMEDHVWRAREGHTPTDEELANEEINKTYVDWIRAYKPIDS